MVGARLLVRRLISALGPYELGKGFRVSNVFAVLLRWYVSDGLECSILAHYAVDFA